MIKLKTIIIIIIEISKVEGLNRKTSYTQIRIQELN